MSYNKNFQISDHIIASKQTRFANYIVDYIAMILIFLIIVMILAIVAGIFDLPYIISWAVEIENYNKIQEYLLGAVLSIFYYSIFESLTARSIGKYITGRVVVFDDGSRPDAGTMLRRALYRIVPLNALAFLWGDQVWHDKYTDTFVVSKSGLKAELQRYNDFNVIGKTDEL